MFAEEGADMAEKQPAIKPSPAPDADLSADVVATIARDAGDRVRCTRIGPNKYRCNWWAPRDGAAYERGELTGLASTMFRVRKSRVLHVTRSPAGLQISEGASRQ